MCQILLITSQLVNKLWVKYSFIKLMDLKITIWKLNGNFHIMEAHAWLLVKPEAHP